MTWTNLLTDIKSLDRADKLRVMQFILVELAIDEGALLKSGVSYPVWTPYNSYQAAHQMMEMLKKSPIATNAQHG
ncbi:MAG: hypothetical protein HZC38_20630 [Chloroflexi bacterium]|nr:hypothetical protein [Chloroflexota bacterium]